MFLPQSFNDNERDAEEILSIAEAMYRQIEASAANVPTSILELLGLPLPAEESFEMVEP